MRTSENFYPYPLTQLDIKETANSFYVLYANNLASETILWHLWLKCLFFRPKTKPDLPKLDIDKAKQNQEQESKVSVEVTIFLVWLELVLSHT